MKLFLDTADLHAIKHWSKKGIIDGVTTNPTHLSKTGQNPKELILAICAALPKGSISVEVTEKEPLAVYKQAKAIASLAKNIVVKIPCHEDYYETIATLANEEVLLNITLVFSPLQALMMCKLGVYYISPFIGRLDDIDVSGTTILEEIRHIIDTYHFKTALLAASLRHVRHVHHAMIVGADIATIPVNLLAKMVKHHLTDQGIAKFDADWQKIGIKTFP